MPNKILQVPGEARRALWRERKLRQRIAKRNGRPAKSPVEVAAIMRAARQSKIEEKAAQQ